MPASSRRAAVLSSSIASTTSSRVPGGCWAARQGSSSSPPTAATSTGKAAPGKIAAVSGASSTTSSPRSRKALATVGSLPARSVINGVIGIDSSGIDANYSAESNSKRFHGRRTLFNVTAPARLGDLPFCPRLRCCNSRSGRCPDCHVQRDRAVGGGEGGLGGGDQGLGVQLVALGGGAQRLVDPLRRVEELDVHRASTGDGHVHAISDLLAVLPARRGDQVDRHRVCLAVVIRLHRRFLLGMTVMTNWGSSAELLGSTPPVYRTAAGRSP